MCKFLEGGYIGDYRVLLIGLIKEDRRSLDYSSLIVLWAPEGKLSRSAMRRGNEWNLKGLNSDLSHRVKGLG